VTSPNEWDLAATREAEHIYHNMFEAHRGVVRSRHRGIMAAFGNDGYAVDVKAKREVEAARQCIAADGGTVLGFGTGPEGYTWTLLFWPGKVTRAKLTAALWEAWLRDVPTDTPGVTFFELLQSSIADRVIRRAKEETAR